MTEREILGIAKALAAKAHAGQLDRAGLPVLGHLARVAAAVRHEGPAVEAVAWLHDSVEDAAVSPFELFEAGIPLDCIDAVLALTRNFYGPETYREFVRRAGACPLAKPVKIADLRDNMTRIPPTDPADRKQYESLKRTRYPKALDYLLGKS